MTTTKAEAPRTSEQELNRVLNALALELPASVHTDASIRIKQLYHDERTAAFHRGVDAAKDAIRSEVSTSTRDEANYYAATCINAIARKCGFDRAADLAPAGVPDAARAAAGEFLETEHEIPPYGQDRMAALTSIILKHCGVARVEEHQPDCDRWVECGDHRHYEEIVNCTCGVARVPVENYSLLRELYDCQLKLDERNFAKGHSFEEWIDHRRRLTTG